eukprot:4273042-Prymnesium_polylepis.1
MRCRAHWWLDTVDGRAELAGVLKCAHPWPARLPNLVETVEPTYNGRPSLVSGYQNGCSPRPDRAA